MGRLEDLPPLSEAQIELMSVLWQKGECSVTEVLEVLQQRREVSRNTVQTTLSRLENKGWLTHRELSGIFIYSPTVTRESSQRKAVKRLLESTFGGSAEGLVLALLGSGQVTEAEMERIRKLILNARKRKER